MIGAVFSHPTPLTPRFPSPGRSSERRGFDRSDAFDRGAERGLQPTGGIGTHRAGDQRRHTHCGQGLGAAHEVVGGRVGGSRGITAVTSISFGSRPSASQWRRSTSTLCATSSGPPKMLHASAYCATRRSVFRSPLPPIMIRGRGRAHRRRAAERLGELVVPAVVGTVVVAPHLQADLDRLLEALEALRESAGTARPAHGARARTRPRRSRARPALRDDVECGDGLREHAGMAVRHPGDERARRRSVSCAGDERERGVALEHRVLGRRHPAPSGRSGP